MSTSSTDLDSHPPELASSPLRFTLQFAGYFWHWYLTIAILQIISSACGVSVSLALGKVVGAISHDTGEVRVLDAVWPPLLLFIALNLGELVFGRIAGFARVHVAPLQRTRVTAHLFAYLQHHSQRYIGSNFAGSLANRISETSMGVNMTLWAIIFDVLPVIVSMSVAVVILTTVSHVLALFTLAWSVLFIVCSYALARRCQPLSKAFSAARSETTGRVVDAVTNLTAVRLFARLGFERAHLQRFLTREIGAARRTFGFNEKIVLFQFVASLVLKIGLLGAGLWLWQQGKIGVPEFVMSTTLSFVVISEARNISRRFLDLFEYIGNIENGVRTIVVPHEIIDTRQARAIQVKHGGIVLRDVTFGYQPERPLFNHLNLTIAAGQRVGLVGYSGSGKSTLINLLLRLYEPQQGSISIDDEDIRHFTQQSLHSQISLIPQEPGLFHRSLLDNIRYGNPQAQEAEVELAARKAHAHEFIARMDQGYHSLVGERGVRLSGGQRQRIAIARVIVKNAPILIMDEATSALDSITEKAIQETLTEVMLGKTVIVVAHRLSTVAQLDRILFFDNGRITEDGSHDELVAKPGGAYRRLWERQVGGVFPQQEAG
ncbi:ABC transporter ATP-binding protein [Pseudomonas sp. 3A(2025)]